MPECPYCSEDIHVETEDIRDEFEYECGHCEKKVKVELVWYLVASEPD